MIRKKYAFSLIEILIAFTLAGILFGCIFSNLSQTGKLQNQLEEVHAIATNRQLVQLKLRPLFAQLPSEMEKEEDEKSNCPIFTEEYSATKTLALCFGLTIDFASDRRFIGPLNYSLYHDEKQQALQLKVSNELGDEKCEEIMHAIQSCKILLFDPEKKAWTDVWPKKNQYLPSMIKLEIVEKNRKEILEFAYPLPAGQQPIDFGSPVEREVGTT